MSKTLKIHNNNIYLSFNDKDEYNHIIIHSPTDIQLKDFIKLLVKNLKKYKFKNINDIENLEFKYISKQKDILEGTNWYEMPEFKIDDNILKSPSITLNYNIDDKYTEDFLNDLEDLIDITISYKTSYLWFPYRIKSLDKYKNLMYESPNYKLKYPIYIISKGRWEKRYTSKYLEYCNIDYKIVVEPQEYNEYNKVIDAKKILILPKKYLNKNQGGIPARNFVLEHSRKNGDKRHWILDDNIMGYYRLNNSNRTFLKGSACFKILEDYVDRYENIKMAGHNYTMFGVPTNINLKPITKNTRIYSSILLSNDIPFKWRGKYNEDTDLSLRLLKKKYPTILFNCILADKQTTLTQKGGNTDTIYNVKNALYLKAKSLQNQHPDVVQIITRFNRTHHYVDYTPFKNNELILKKNIKLNKNKIDNFGMKLVKLKKN